MLRGPPLLFLPAILSGCLQANAGDAVPAPPPGTTSPAIQPDTATLDALDAAVEEVNRAALAVAAGVADGSVDLSTSGPALVMAYTRLALDELRLDALIDKATSASVAVVDPTVTPPPVDPGAADERQARKEKDLEKQVARTETPPTRPEASAPSEAAPTRSEAPASSAKVESEKTGIASVDKFLLHVATVSADLEQTKKKLEGARGKLTGALGLAKKFKPADAQKALTEKLGTGYKISLSPSVKVTPGPDAKDPAIASDIKSAYTDLQDVSKRIPAIVSSATDIGKEAVEVPKKAKSELEALGPLKAAEALGKVSKGAKTVTKVPKDAKELSDEVALWTKIAGG